jgi:Domain of unknown function (DUF4301)
MTSAVSETTAATFTDQDLRQLAAQGLSLEEARRQMELLRHPPPPTRVLRPCSPGDGIRQLDDNGQQAMLASWAKAAEAGRVAKFVPASGAASRMFKGLLAALDGKPSPEADTFFAELQRFPFLDDLAAALGSRGLDLGQLREDGRAEDRQAILRGLLTPEGLDYAELPKGLIPFHRYANGEVRTPFEEHLADATFSTRDRDGVCRLHFTVPPGDEARFRDLLAQAAPDLEKRYGVRFEVSFSFQSPATDTLAADPEGNPFRDDDGTLLFRPGGHGALLQNLHDQAREGADLVLIRNIDNVLPEPRKPRTERWRQILIGQLAEVQSQVHHHLQKLEAPDPSPEVIEEARTFTVDQLHAPLPRHFETAEPAEKARLLRDRLDRPLRVCGIIRNLGEPGGGPFWVEGQDGQISLQIVETAQIAKNDPDQQARLAASTHFNPTDLACALRDRHNQPYDLPRYVDPATAFVAAKSHEGRPLTALERPGLWNGSMAGWNTLFLEMADETFAPVKTVIDLLRPEHQVEP